MDNSGERHAAHLEAQVRATLRRIRHSDEIGECCITPPRSNARATVVYLTDNQGVSVELLHVISFRT